MYLSPSILTDNNFITFLLVLFKLNWNFQYHTLTTKIMVLIIISCSLMHAKGDNVKPGMGD